MIEFRAECGHTIRARNEDAGKMVNCAYCGKKALVPSDEADPMDSLLADTLEESREQAQELDRATPWGKGLGMAPLRIAWTAIFVVLVLSVLLLTLRWVYREVVSAREGPEPAPVAATGSTPLAKPAPAEAAPGAERQEAQPSPAAPRPRNPLADLPPRESGVCVFSVPPDLDVYVEELPVRGEGRLSTNSFKGQTQAGEGLMVTLGPGQYRVSVVTTVRNADLMDHPDYPHKVRETIEGASDPEAAADAAEDYFIEDGGEEWRVEKLWDQYYLIKTYEVELGRRWRPIYSLFVPQVSCAELLGFAPREVSFVFDARLAEQELRYRGIPLKDHKIVLSALERIGKAVVTDTELGTVKVFWVLPDGSVASKKLIGEQIPPIP